MNSLISKGVFFGDVEPGVFHAVTDGPRPGEEAPTTHQTGAGDVAPAESETA